MLGTVFFLSLTLFSAAVLIIFLLRAGAARPMTVWIWAALLPVLAAMSAAQAGQARASRALRDYAPAPALVTLHTGGQTFQVTLSPSDAECLERTLRLRTDTDLALPQNFAPIPIRAGTVVEGALPPSAVVEALSLRGQLHCQNFKPVKPQQ